MIISLRPVFILKHNNLDSLKSSLHECLSKPRTLSRVGLVWVIIATLLGGILVDIQIAEAYEYTEVEAITVVVPPKKEVRIEVVYNWDKARIEQEVMKAFPDAPIMLKVMRCEGGYDIDAYNPTNGSGDKGLFQISTLHHGKRVKALGLDMNNPSDNIKYAKMLYDEQGLEPWKWSKHCWSK